MKASTERVLTKVAELRDKMKAVQSPNQSLAEVHEDVLNLARLLLYRKRDYDSIDIDVPTIVLTISRIGGTSETIESKPDRSSEKELADNLSMVLDRIENLYSLKKEIETDGEHSSNQQLKEIRKELAEIRNDLKLKNRPTGDSLNDTK